MPQVTSKWNDILTGSPGSQEILDVSNWLNRAALDAIGEGKGGFTTTSSHLLTLAI
jgi:hypothetical protein